MTAKRNNEGKPGLHKPLLFAQGLAELAAHMEAGEAKYPNDEDSGLPNWLLGGRPDSDYLGAIVRHTARLVSGEEYDEELGTTHVAAIAWNAFALAECNRKGRPLTASCGKPAIAPVPKFTEGDHVRVTDDLDALREVWAPTELAGTRGRVTRVEDGDLVAVRMNADSGGVWWFRPTSLVHIIEPGRADL